jgi:hypothetical protein
MLVSRKNTRERNGNSSLEMKQKKKNAELGLAESRGILD